MIPSIRLAITNPGQRAFTRVISHMQANPGANRVPTEIHNDFVVDMVNAGRHSSLHQATKYLDQIPSASDSELTIIAQKLEAIAK